MIRTVAASQENELDEFCRRARIELVGALSLYLGDAGVAEELANESLLRAVGRWVEVGMMANPDGGCRSWRTIRTARCLNSGEYRYWFRTP